MTRLSARNDVLLFDGEYVEDAAPVLAESSVREVVLRLCRDSTRKDLDFLLAFQGITSLKISSVNMIDVTAIARMEKLKSLRLELGVKVSFGFETLEPQTLEEPYHMGKLVLTFGGKKDSFPEMPMPHIKNLGVWEYEGVDLEFLKNFPSVEKLSISEASKRASWQVFRE